jgi:hypothetical protein
MITSSPILAAMITPAMLYAGAACAAIPILIHLISRRRFHRVRWAATQFLLEANRQNRRRVRIEELILLALRCLAMLLIGMVLGRIFVRPQTLAAVLGSPAGTEYVVILDDSFSMGLIDTDRQTEDQDTTVFDRSLTTVERLVTWLREESPGDALTITGTSHPNQPIVTEANLGRLDPAAFRQNWRSRKPSYRRADLPQTFAAVRQLLDTRRSAGAVIYLVSDFQRIDWLTDNSDRTSKEKTSPLAPLAGWDRDGRSLKVVLVDVGSDKTDNLAITDIETRQAQAVAGIGTRLIARVANFGDSESRPGTMQVFVGQAGQPTVPVPAVPAGQSLEVPLEVTFPQPDSSPLTVDLQGDALPVDNSRFCAVPVIKALRVLIVNGEPSPDPYQDEAFLLSVALRPQGPQFSGNEVTIVEESELEQTDLASFHAVLLLNVARISDTAAARLESYVAAGGGLALFTGDQVDAAIYNRVLYRDGAGLLPARLGDPTAVPNDSPGLRLGEANTSHPALRPFRNLLPTCFEGALVYAYSRVDMKSSPTSLPATTNPSQAVSTLLRLDDPDKSPLILQKDFQAGHVWLITTTADKEWTNLPDHPVFIILMMEMTQYLARRPDRTGGQLVGQPVTLTLDPGRYQPTAIVRTPSYPEEPAASVNAQPGATGNETVIRWPRTERPGIYEIELTDQSGGHTIERAAVNVDSTESDLRRIRRDELQQAIAGWPAEYVRGEELSRAAAGGARKELWPILLILLTAVLMSEQTLAWWFGANRRWSALFRSDPT